MTLQMHLVVLKETGHILAGVAQALAAGVPSVEALAGRDLPLMMRDPLSTTTTASTLVPAELLEVKTVAYDPKVLASPLAHVVDGGRVAEIPPNVPLTAVDLHPATIEIGGVLDVPVIVMLATDADPTVERRAQSGKIGVAPKLILRHAILPGDTEAAISSGKLFAILVACAGRRLEWLGRLAT
jgi:hypothetical protein